VAREPPLATRSRFLPRSEQELESHLNRGLSPQHVERFAMHGHYLLWVSEPCVGARSSGRAGAYFMNDGAASPGPRDEEQ
jgi:hypothetical protein